MKHIDALNHKDTCSGCSACVNSCPKQCISLKEDEEGFLYPVVDESDCINCSLCLKICPFTNDSYKRSETSLITPKVYAAKHQSNNIRKYSTSGGIFTALSDYILEINGAICGAAFNSESQCVEHIIAFSHEERDRIRGSKYVQSKLGNIFQDIKSLLEKEIPVLFTGTPCQTAGLYAYLKKDYANLYIADILCHSAPSPLILKRTIEQYTRHAGNISFRDKTRGWRGSYHFQIERKDKSSISNVTFLPLFFKGLINRPSCYNCHFTNIKRPSDLTIGDYWNIQNVDSSFEDELGVSCILVNSNKGNYLFDKIKKSLNYQATDLKPSIQSCMQRPTTIPRNRNAFWYDFKKYGFVYCENKYGHYTIWENIKANKLAPWVRKLGIAKFVRKIKKIK